IAHGCDLTTAKLTFRQLIADRFSIYRAKNHRLGKMVEAKPESRSFLDQTFGLSEHTNLQTEFIAGLTTFLAMVYIVFVNPMILASAGMGQGAVFVATCIAAAVSTLVMALYYPIAIAPDMGLNPFSSIHSRSDL